MSATLSAAELDVRFSTPGAQPTLWTDAVKILRSTEVYWISTVHQNGRPHVAPIAAVLYEGDIYFCTGPGEQKALNLARNASCSITAGTPEFNRGLDVVLEGEVTRVTDPILLGALAAEYDCKYQGFFGFAAQDGHFTNSGGGVALVYRVMANKAFAFSKGDSFSQTRWRFGV